MAEKRIEDSIALMMSFAARTGLSPGRPAKRYLWTDAFAVCNFLSLARATGEERYRELALRLVDQVHHSLGRHRADDLRSGWISGLPEGEGEAHPTAGGLRIGKNLPERGPNEPFDERLEWEQDGQYFHYLTKWVHALDQVARTTDQPRFNLWARELAETAQHAFTWRPFPGGAAPRMHWKMSTDLKRALVPSMGQHDPLDGYITCLQLRSTAARLSNSAGGPTLEDETRQFAAMLKGAEWTTADPLGLGGLLADACRVDQLARQRVSFEVRLLESLLTTALAGLKHYLARGELKLPAEHRLAFRELGLSIGLHAVERMSQAAEQEPGRVSPEVKERLQQFMQYAPVAVAIESFWQASAHISARTWSEHRDINEVMLATSLAPDGFLSLAGSE
jgi:hypothetical protein